MLKKARQKCGAPCCSAESDLKELHGERLQEADGGSIGQTSARKLLLWFIPSVVLERLNEEL